MDEFIPAYERDAYQTKLATEIVASGTEGGRPWVVLADTIFYPEGGGQPADRGWISGVPVGDVQRVEGVIRHYPGRPIAEGRVELELDWNRRFDIMQQHTGQHLITALAADRFDWPTTAFHLGEAASDVELDVPSLTPEQGEELEEAVAAEIAAGRPVNSRRVSPEEMAGLEVRTRGLPTGHEGRVRLVEIEGVDLNTCGGTHLRSTAELGTVKLLGTESMRGGTRVYYVAGGRVRRRLAAHEKRTALLRALLGTSEEEFAATIEAKLSQLRDALRRQRTLEQQLAAAAAEALARRSETLIEAHFPSQGMAFLQRIAREVTDSAPQKGAFLTASDPDVEGIFVLAAGAQCAWDLKQAGAEVAAALGGKGGGSGRMFQGKAKSLSNRKRAIELLKALLGE